MDCLKTTTWQDTFEKRLADVGARVFEMYIGADGDCMIYHLLAKDGVAGLFGKDTNTYECMLEWCRIHSLGLSKEDLRNEITKLQDNHRKPCKEENRMDYQAVRAAAARKLEEIDREVRILKERRDKIERFLQACNVLDTMGIILGETVEQTVGAMYDEDDAMFVRGRIVDPKDYEQGE